MSNEEFHRELILRPNEALLSFRNDRKHIRSKEFHQDASRHSKQHAWATLAKCSTVEARKLISFEQARARSVLPLTVFHDSHEPLLTAVTDRELTSEERKDLKFLCGMDVLFERHGHDDVQRAICAAYQGDLQELEKAVFRSKEASKSDRPREESSYDKLLQAARQSPVPQLLEKIVHHALALQASDVHLEPLDGDYRLRVRVHGALQELPSIKISAVTGKELTRHIKICAKLDTTVSTQPQEGGFLFQSDAWSVRLRVSIIPQRGGEKVVIRLLDNDFPKCTDCNDSPFRLLGCSAEQERLLKLFLGANEGAILIAGPTGSGKSTLLYTAIQHLNCSWRNIVTLEDPIERYLPGVTQCEVSHKEGMTFESFLQPILRQDPDVVMIGEIRSKETAETALTAGITGHLVLSTVHAGNCIEVFARLGQLGVSKDLLALSLRLVVSQRLIPKNCHFCIRETLIPQSLVEFFGVSPETKFIQSVGCSHCAHSGVSGRVAVFEFLPICDALRKELLLQERFQAQKIREIAGTVGYVPLAVAVRELLVGGAISPQQALRSLGIAPEFTGSDQL